VGVKDGGGEPLSMLLQGLVAGRHWPDRAGDPKGVFGFEVLDDLRHCAVFGDLLHFLVVTFTLVGSAQSCHGL
jgi:hypothetical protein